MISLQSVTKLFGSFVAVDDVTLEVRAGEFLTLLGPSGCGKTTLLRMISGFERPTRGRVVLNGEDVTELPPYQRDVNQVFQSYALFPHLTVEKNIAFGLRSRKTPRAEMNRRVAEAIELVGLNGMEHRKPDQLSGGQRQRVALARALVCEPKVLLLDEPLAALDAKLRRAMQLELKKLQQRLEITFVFVTHDQDEAIVMSDRIAVINGGKIEQIGAAAEIYRKPATRFVADFLGQANLIAIDHLLELIPTLRDSLANLVQGDGITPSPGTPGEGGGEGTEIRDKGQGGKGQVENCPHPNPLPEYRARGKDGEFSGLACIRPEKIGLFKERPASQECFEAEILDIIFRGPITQVTLKAAGGLNLTALAIASASQGAFATGQKIYCQIDAANVVLIRSS